MATDSGKDRTLALVDKYQKLIGGLLNLAPSSIKFYVTQSGDPTHLVSSKELEIGAEYQPDADKKDWIIFNAWCEGSFVVRCERTNIKPTNISTFKLYRMPHCCGIIVSCNAFVAEQYRHRRVGTVLNNLRQDIARMLGYTIMLCTDIAQNEHQRRLLKTNGWKDVLDFKNRRTGNTVILSYIGL
jgi:hypothetical protein